MVLRIAAIVLLLGSSVFAGIIEDVRMALNADNFSAADSALNAYRSRNGVDLEYLEALSWMARGALSAGKLDDARRYASDTEKLAKLQLMRGPLDSQPHLATALGASLEVEAQALARQNQRAQAVALLRQALATYGNTSIRARLQKNLNLLNFTGSVAPPLAFTSYLGPKPPSLGSLKGSAVLLFFWAHWCGDCKAEAPIITRLRSEFAGKGLAVVGPTQLYGYAGAQEDVPPKQELAYIDAVRQKYYSGLLDMPVPVSRKNFDTYGASTTPTLVIVDRAGRVAMYHPGAMPYDALRSEIEQVLAK